MDNKYNIIFGLGGLAIVAAAIVYIFTDKDRKKVKKLEAEASLPPEYWAAKVEEAKASVEKHRIDTESQERLTIDSRERTALENTNKREFEKNAPKEYWEHKKIEAEECTKRTIEEERLKNERETARQNSQAIKDSARMIGRAISKGDVWYPGV